MVDTYSVVEPPALMLTWSPKPSMAWLTDGLLSAQAPVPGLAFSWTTQVAVTPGGVGTGAGGLAVGDAGPGGDGWAEAAGELPRLGGAGGGPLGGVGRS